MSRERTFSNQYYLDSIKKVDKMIASEKLTDDEIKSLEEEKLYLYECLGLVPNQAKKCTTINDISHYLGLITKRMYIYYNEIGFENINRLIVITDFIVRHSSERKIHYTKMKIDANEVLDEGMKFFKGYDEEFYQIIEKLINHEENLYNFTNKNTSKKIPDDHCVFLFHNQLPIVNVFNSKNIGLCSTTIHEMQHQIDFMYRYMNGSSNPYHNTLLDECSAILTELLFLDQFSQKNPFSDEINDIYFERIKGIEHNSANISRYLKIMKYICINRNALSPKILLKIFESNGINATESLLIKYINQLYDYNLYSSIKYLISYLLALDIRELYYKDASSAISKIKNIINLKVYNFSSLKVQDSEFKLSDYKDGAFNHLKHVMKVESKGFQLLKKVN